MKNQEIEKYIEKRMLENHIKEGEVYFCKKDCKRISLLRLTSLMIQYKYEFVNRVV